MLIRRQKRCYEFYEGMLAFLEQVSRLAPRETMRRGENLRR